MQSISLLSIFTHALVWIAGFFRCFQDLSIGSLIDDAILSTVDGNGYTQNLLDGTITDLALQSSSNQCSSVLPSIDTFWHQNSEPRFIGQERTKRGSKYNSRRSRISDGTNVRSKSFSTIGSFVGSEKRQFLCPIESCARSTPSNAFKRRYLLEEHLNFHRKLKPFLCDRCPQAFTSKQNLSRHRLIHAGVTYACPECPRVYNRSSDRSKCLQNHKLGNLHDFHPQPQTKNALAPAAPKVPSKLPLVGPVNGPHVCPICPDKRGYKQASSLRKHMRLHHPLYKRPSRVVQSESLTETASTPDNAQGARGGADQQRPPSEETVVVNYSMKTAATAVATDYAGSQIPVAFNVNPGTFYISTEEGIYAVDPQYNTLDQFFPVVGTAAGGATESTNEMPPAILMEVSPFTLTTMNPEESRRLVSDEAYDGVVDPSSTSLTSSFPVDLCTSALCLTVGDPSAPSSMNLAVHPATVDSEHVCQPVGGGAGDSGSVGASGNDCALDLTELPYEVIDLSHAHPVDLSGAHAHSSALRTSMWEPEPGFSFTDLLNVDVEETEAP